jgi:hypothetical protein
MRAIKYRVVDSKHKNEIGMINNVLLLETERDNKENAEYMGQFCDNNTPVGKRFNQYVFDQTGLTDEDIFFVLQSGEEKDRWELDGTLMERIK